ncbi:Mediator of RNA polymerase II transcription subunit 18 [Savitreella phatthalungensis]
MPEFGVKDVVSRGVHHCPIREGDILALAKELGYTKGYEHQERGHHLTRRNLKIAVYQVYAHPPSAAAEFVTVGRADTWIVQADIDVAQGNNPAEVQRATQDLLRLQNDLSSYIDLRTVRDELR